MSRRFARADDAPNFFAALILRRPGMDHEQYDITLCAGRPDRPPALLVGIGIRERYRQRVIEYELGELERHLVITPVDASFLRIPSPAQNLSSHYKFVATI